MLDASITQLATQVLSLLTLLNKKIAIAESCTGGLLTAYITSIPGSSKILDRSFITYSNESKIDLLDVEAHDIQSLGAVSSEVVASMALGALKNSIADITIATTGIAGPDNDGLKPVGLVYIAMASNNKSNSQEHHFIGDRNKIRHDTVIEALRMILSIKKT